MGLGAGLTVTGATVDAGAGVVVAVRAAGATVVFGLRPPLPPPAAEEMARATMRSTHQRFQLPCRSAVGFAHHDVTIQ